MTLDHRQGWDEILVDNSTLRRFTDPSPLAIVEALRRRSMTVTEMVEVTSCYRGPDTSGRACPESFNFPFDIGGPSGGHASWTVQDPGNSVR